MTKEELVQVVKDMIAAPSCYGALKELGAEWLNAVGTEKEVAVFKKLLAEVEGDIMPVDGVIAFAGSSAGISLFGEEKAKALLAHAEEIKAAGAVYCDCPACSAGIKLLENKGVILG
ncbi:MULTISPECIES: hypothetical protein [Megasphaera]|uniref:Molecular chaperone Hsp90 n=1 Tax=Megasphaera vaginalis (ex Srinivasan et al. 2021) TaxID=1111454 RepID=U7UFT9_9FIRM|nr:MULTISPECIES: hypothetical protein [Megasphaera]ERT58215.1 hypothetical protein HMPREF1250_0048 [Megasphaera vaginalis (ex Srinivasan et al. 2021)]